ncbi:MAG: M28 family peptidase [Cyclobacteriaceae bacterium]|nr:M28 family peptidase [Cyclobacteriaceae bacterium]
MKKLSSLLLLVLTVQFSWSQENPAAKYASLITTADLKDNLSILASDALEGRKTGTRGQKMAAAFISNHFEQLGLTAPVNGSYYMPVDLYSVAPADIYVKAGVSKYSNFNEIMYYGSADSDGEIVADIVFVGKGREEDYANLIVKDKAVALQSDPLSFSIMSGLRKPVALAREKGAKMVFIIPAGKPDEFKTFAAQMQGFLSGGNLTLTKPDPTSPNKGIFFLNQTAAEKVFNTTAAKLAAAAAAEPAKKMLAKVKLGKVSYQVAMNITAVKSENILGYMEGTDKKDELVVITAHFDHIGKNPGEGKDVINNGADDDGSGTVSVLQMAKAFAQAKKDGKGPRRSILFMTVTGEEQGLFGSEYYSEHPVFPLANTVVDINIDMIGRRDPEHKDKPDYVYVIGADKLSSELQEINERTNRENEKLEFDYTYNDENHPTNLYKRSDHWNFAKKGIPIVFFFDGIHEDYHQVSDEISKIEFDLLAKRAKTAFHTAWEVANREGRLIVDKK